MRRLLCRFFGHRYGPPDLAIYSVFGPFCLRCGDKWE